MKPRGSGRGPLTDLRARAEKRLDRGAASRLVEGAGDAAKQLHELQVHQIELEMQNQELQRIREEVEAGLASYTDLYDFAPVGYFTLDRRGRVTKLNLHGARLLRTARADLIERGFAEFLPAGARGLFGDYLARVFDGGAAEVLELELVAGDAQTLFVHVEAVADATRSSCRAVVVDITARRQAEQRADELLRQNRSLTRRMFKVQETERLELARELHDELGQWITAIQAEAEAIRGAGATRDARLLASADAIINTVGELHRVIRQRLRRLRPSLLDTLGLAESLQELIAQWGERHPRTSCELDLSGDFGNVPESLGITLYRIVQEALTNVTKHARARHVLVRLESDVDDAGVPESIRLSVKDDGIGMDAAQVSPGLGLMGMRERVIAVDGEFSLSSGPHQGVRIQVLLPLAPQGGEQP